MPTTPTLKENGGGGRRGSVVEQPPPGWVNPIACLPYEQRVFTDAEILLMPLDQLLGLYYRLGKWEECKEVGLGIEAGDYRPDPEVSRGCPPAVASGVEDDLKARIFTLRVDARNLPDPEQPGAITGLYWFTASDIRPKCDTPLLGEVITYTSMAVSLLSPGGWYRLILTAINTVKMLAAKREQEARMRKARALKEAYKSGLVAAYIEVGKELLVEWGIEYLYRSPAEAAKWPTDNENRQYAAMLGLEHPAMIVPIDLPAWPYMQKKYFLEWFEERARKRRLLELWAWANKVQAAEAMYRHVLDPLTGADTLFPLFDAGNKLRVRAGSTKPAIPLAQFMVDMPDGLDRAGPTPAYHIWPRADPKTPFETSKLGPLQSATHPRILDFIHYVNPYPAPPVLSPQYGRLYEYPGEAVAQEVLGSPHIPVTEKPLEQVLTPEQKGELPEWFPDPPVNLPSNPAPVQKPVPVTTGTTATKKAVAGGRTPSGQASGKVAANQDTIELGIVALMAYIALNK